MGILGGGMVALISETVWKRFLYCSLGVVKASVSHFSAAVSMAQVLLFSIFVRSSRRWRKGVPMLF
jgi:hypothetical protein